MFQGNISTLNKYLLACLLLNPASSIADKPMDCSGVENQRKNIFEVKEFDCESESNCAVGVWAPSEIEGLPFVGFSAVVNQTAPEEYDLAFGLKGQSINNEVVGFIYGTLQSLEKTQINVSYWIKGMGCPLQSSVKLKHNKSKHAEL